MNKDKETIKQIIKIIQTPGSKLTDGECLDKIIELIENNGYEFDWKQYEE